VLALKNREKQTCAFVVERYLVEMVEVNRKTKGADEARRMLERAIVPIATPRLLHAWVVGSPSKRFLL
jgi:hypothetical protein